MTKNKTQKNIAMKDSGIDWIGDIPSDWVPRRGKFLFRNKKQINRGMICDNVLSLTMQGVISRSELGEGGLVPSDYSTFQLFKKDDLVFKLIDLENYKTSRVGLVHEDGIMSSAYIRVFPKFNQDLDVKYFYYFYYNLYLEGIYNFVGMGVRSTMNAADLLNMELIIPPKPTQEKIVAFLDEKTEAMAELVEKKKKMIELLKEKRSSLITHAVTKGLPARRPARSRNAGGDENEKCPPASGWKDSGVEWIGEIPEGWEVKRLKNVSTYNDEILNENTPDDFEFEYIDISSVNLSDGIKTTERVSYNNAPSRARRVVRVNDIIVSTVRTYLRAIATITNKYAKCIVSTGFAVIRPKKIKESFLSYFMQSENFVFSVINHSEGVAYPAINASRLVELNILIPPKQTQQKIVEFLDKETAKIDKVISKIEKQIELLDEYKASLIYHAVTGKIEV